MDESMQNVFTEQLGMSSDLLSGITEDDLDVCNETYSLYEDGSALCKGDTNEESWDFNTCNWMSQLPDSTRFNDIIMPGSHDAGMSRCDYPGYVNVVVLTKKEQARAQRNLSVTQNHNIYQQLLAGTRYFDIRLEWRHGALRTSHTTSVLGTDFGCNGETFTEIMGWTNIFLDQYPRETVIMTLSHFKAHDALVQTTIFLEKLIDLIKDRIYVTTTPKENLAKVPLKDLRGKVIFIIDDDTPTMIDSTQGRHFYRDASVYEKPHPGWIDYYNAMHIPHPNAATLSVFDVYSHREDTQNVINFQTDYLYKTAGMRQPYLFLYSWTRTPNDDIVGGTINVLKAAGNIFSIEKLANDWPDGVNIYLPTMLLALYTGGFNMPNIVYYDYINTYYNIHIIQYNFRKWNKAISDRYKITIDEKNKTRTNYLYSMNQNLMRRSYMEYGTLSFKKFTSQDNAFFKIDKIDWRHENGQWSSTSQTYPAYWWYDYGYLYDFKLQNTRWTTSSGGSIKIVEKLAKEIP